MDSEHVFLEIVASDTMATPVFLANLSTAYLLFYVEERAFAEAEDSKFANLPAEKIAIFKCSLVIEYHCYPRIEHEQPTVVQLTESEELDYYQNDENQVQHYLFHLGDVTYEILCRSIEMISPEEPTMKQEIARISEFL